MSYGDFTTQIKGRGAASISRSEQLKVTVFDYLGTPWQCVDKNRSTMSNELADGYEMVYCLDKYCERLPAGRPADLGSG